MSFGAAQGLVATSVLPEVMPSPDLSDFAPNDPTIGDLLVGDGTNWDDFPIGADTFVLTADSGEASGLKWAAIPAGITTFVGLSDTPANFTSQTLKALRVNAGETAVEFVGVTGTGSAVFDGSPTITTPTIASFANSAHNHADAAGGGQITLTTGVTGVLPVANGGTALAVYVVGDIVHATGTTTLAGLAGVATGNAVISGGVGVAPAYGKIGLTTHISGTLSIANGGTNATAKEAAFDNLSPVTTRGDIIIRNATVNTRLAVGAANEVLTSDGTDVAWAAAAGGGDLDDAYDFGGAHLGRTVNVDTSFPVLFTGGGTPPATDAKVVFHLHDSSSTSSDVEMSITAGTAGIARINLGSSADEDRCTVSWDNNTSTFEIVTLSGGQAITVIDGSAITLNEGGSSFIDTRFEGGSLPYMLFMQASTAIENIALLDVIEPDWKGMDRGYHLGDVTTAPTGDPIAGIFVWSAAGAGNARGGGGTVTPWAPAGPHCELCGYDSWTVASMNMNWKSWCFICGVCGTEYKGGPQSVLEQLTSQQKTEVIKQASTWEDVKQIRGIAS